MGRNTMYEMKQRELASRMGTSQAAVARLTPLTLVPRESCHRSGFSRHR